MHSLYIGNNADAYAPSAKSQDAFITLLATLGTPFDAAVFSQLERRAAMVTLFISIAAESFAILVRYSMRQTERTAQSSCRGSPGYRKALSNLNPNRPINRTRDSGPADGKLGRGDRNDASSARSERAVEGRNYPGLAYSCQSSRRSK